MLAVQKTDTTPEVSARTVLSIAGLGHRYGDRSVLEDFNLSVARGEIIGLLGPNGSGKSTVLALLAGLLPLIKGQIAWCGTPVRPGDAILRRELGVVFQSPALDGRLSIRENLELAATLRGLFGAPARARVAELLEHSGLADRAADLVGKLSGGQRRRVDIARALLHHPRLLLLDEPTTGLDEASFREMWSRLLAMRASSGLAIVVATHRPDEAELCQRLSVLVTGRTVLETTPGDLRALVSGDVVTVSSSDPATTAGTLRSAFPTLPIAVDGAEVVVTVDKGHEFIPVLVQALQGGPVPTGISLRRPSLADAFLKATGQGLGARP